MKIRIRKILCPVDFSPNSDHAVKYALAFATAHDAELLLVHVMELPPYPAMDYPVAPQFAAGEEDRIRKASTGQLEALTDQLREQHGRINWRLAKGYPFPEIVRLAREEEVDLIVIGTHGRTGLAHVLLGSVAEKVVRKAPCPVLTVKHPEHEFLMP